MNQFMKKMKTPQFSLVVFIIKSNQNSNKMKRKIYYNRKKEITLMNNSI